MSTLRNSHLNAFSRIGIFAVTIFFLSCGPSFASAERCSLLFRPPFSEWNDAELIAQTRTNLAYLEKVPYEYTSLLVSNRTVIRGLPKKGSEALFAPRVLSPDEVKNTVFRHYTTPEGLEKIKSRSRLVAGPVSYVASPYVYPDVTGVFLTTTAVKQEKVGLDSAIHSAWVDLRLPEGTAVLYLEPGIYVVPGSAAAPEWLIRSAKAGGQSPAQIEKFSETGFSAMEVPILLEATKSAEAINAPTAP